MPTRATEAGAITLQFNPPSGTIYTKTTQRTTSEEIGLTGRHDVRSMTLKSKFHIYKVPEGYIIRETFLSLAAAHNGKKTVHPLANLLKNGSLLYTLNPVGHLVTLHGLGASLSSAMMTSEQANQQLTEREAFVLLKADDWINSMEQYLERPVVLGQRWAGKEKVDMENGWRADFRNTTEILGAAKCGDHDCIRIHSTSEGDPNVMHDMMFDYLRTRLDAGGRSGINIKILDARVDSSAERRLDPATLLPQGASLNTTVSMQIEVEGETTIPYLYTIKTFSRYDYVDPAKVPVKAPKSRSKTVKPRRPSRRAPGVPHKRPVPRKPAADDATA